ncbi:MAG: TSUP family transporter, partial [Usitatibacter sp.]
MTWPIIALLAVSTLVTSFISGILGMAGGMILMGVLLAILPVPIAMMMHGITQLASNAWRAFMLRASVDWRIVRGYAIGSFAAMMLFALIQIVASKPVALIMLGLMPFVALVLPESLHLNVERRGHSAACGVVCTGLSLVAGVSGPVLDVFFVRSKMGRHAVIATKAITQSLTHAMKIGYFGGIVVTAGADFPALAAAMMVCLAFVGTQLSKRV